eukprot:TRINITY_DN28356_c0_g4_i2.p1 TRINITY_DN28356_c0_g4~~TRINITY_DN28356_c0_g4_i2.p1  ORF type:complete len:1040 (-),score=232.01 TRINITY_DN28356_c0_g4_i2:345-3347(-)
MDPQRRITQGPHVEFESNLWQTAFLLSMELARISKCFVTLLRQIFLCADKRGLMKSFRASATRMFEKLVGVLQSVEKLENVDFSFHWNLRRFFSNVCGILIFFGVHPVVETRSIEFWKDFMEPLVDLRVCLCQISCGMWSRNGLSMPHQVSLYRSRKFSPGVALDDLGILQLSCCQLECGDVVDLIYRKFSHHLPHAEVDNQFLNLLVQLMTERDFLHHGAGNSSVSERDVVHWLLAGKTTFSELEKVCLGTSEQKDELRSVLNRIALFREPAGLSHGKFELRSTYLTKFDSFFFGYEESDKECAEKNYFHAVTVLTRKLSKATDEPDFSLEALSSFPGFDSARHLESVPKGYRQIFGTLANSTVLGVIKNVFLEEDIGKHLCEFQLCARLLSIAIVECFEKRVFDVCFENVMTEKFIDLLPALISVYRRCPYNSREFSNPLYHLGRLLRVMLAHLQQNLPSEISMDIRRVLEVDEKKDEFELDKKQNRIQRMRHAQRRALRAIHLKQKSFIQKNSDLFNDDSCRNDGNLEKQCILCRSGESADPLGLLAWTSTSSVMRDELSPRYRCASDNESFDGPVVRPCGHVMHSSCKNNYLAHLNQRFNSFLRFEGWQVVDVRKGEFLCPFCKGMVNTLIPVVPKEASDKILEKKSESRDLSFEFFGKIAENSHSGADSCDDTFLHVFLECFAFTAKHFDLSGHVDARHLADLRHLLDGIIFSLSNLDCDSSLIGLLDLSKSADNVWTIEGTLHIIKCLMGWYLVENRSRFPFLSPPVKAKMLECACDFSVRDFKGFIRDEFVKSSVKILCLSALESLLGGENVCDILHDPSIGSLPPVSKLRSVAESMIQSMPNSVTQAFRQSLKHLNLLLVTFGLRSLCDLSSSVEQYFGDCEGRLISSVCEAKLVSDCWEKFLRIQENKDKKLILHGLVAHDHGSAFVHLPEDFGAFFEKNAGLCANCQKTEYLCLLCGVVVCHCKSHGDKGPLSSHCSARGDSASGVFLES